MKREIILSFWTIVLTVTIQAQNAQSENDPDQVQTVFSQEVPVGWWIAPEYSYTMFDTRSVSLFGLSGGIIINHNFSIGLEGTGILTNNNLRFSGINNTDDLYLYGGYGGLYLEYRILPLKPVNLAFPLLIGGGAAAYSTWGPNNWHNPNIDPSDDIYNWDSYFAIEPGVTIGINLLKFMRFDGGITYRYVYELNLPETATDLMNGLNAKFSLKFGKF